MEIKRLLKTMVDRLGSDLYLTTGISPSLKINGAIVTLQEPKLKMGDVKRMAYEIMGESTIKAYEQSPEVNMALSLTDIGRFRVNIFKQRNETAMVVRHIKSEIPSMSSLNVPTILEKLILEKQGLFLVVGPTSSGKSTTLAALLEYRNTNTRGHIVTIEDPIEFIHKHKQSIINQREVGLDTDSYGAALQNTLRQAPDVIFIGEIRNKETMEYAINFSETGHLCVSTLHAINSNQAIDRIINFFPKNQRNQILQDLSINLKTIVSQRLIPTIDTDERIAAFEVMVSSPLISDLIYRGELNKLKETMSNSKQYGMQTFDCALYDLVKSGTITSKQAIANADSQNNLRLKLSLEEQVPTNKRSLDLRIDKRF